jgi:O-acetyl-ADP-ribose deacetylase (regulator of RNase III)
MITAARDYSAEYPESSVDLVVFVLFTPDDYKTFKRFVENEVE